MKQETDFIGIGRFTSARNEEYKYINILVLVAGPGSDGRYMHRAADMFAQYGNVYVLVQNIFRDKYNPDAKIDKKEHINDLMIKTANDLVQFETVNNLKNVITVGHCLIGQISLHYGELSKNVLASLLISTPFSSIKREFSEVWQIMKCMCRLRYIKSLWDPEMAKELLFYFLSNNCLEFVYDQKDIDDFRVFIDSIKEMNPKLIYNFYVKGAVSLPHLPKLIPDIRKEKQAILWIGGDRDKLVGDNDYDTLKDYLSCQGYDNVQRQIISDTKHFCFFENEERFSAIVSDYMKGFKIAE